MQTDDFTIISLTDFLNNLGKESVSKILSTFESRKESDTENFLRTKAIEMELRDLSRTYLGLSSDGRTVLGYITIGIKSLRVPSENILSGKTLKNMNIDGETGIAQSYLIGQLSRCNKSPNGFGEILMDVAFKHLRTAKKNVGCRLVRLDCYQELIPYYQQYGFKVIVNSNNGSLNQMLMVI